MCIVGDDVDREYMIQMEQKLYMELNMNKQEHEQTSSIRRQIHLITFMKLCIQYQNTYQSLTCVPPAENSDSIYYVHI